MPNKIPLPSPHEGDGPSEDQAIDLFRFFESTGSQDKQQMISLVTWLSPVAFGLIAYCWNAVFVVLLDKETPDPVAIVAGAVGVLLSVYAVYIIKEFLTHADKKFEYANKAIEQLPPRIRELLMVKQKKENFALLQLMRKWLNAHYVGSVFLVLLWAAVFTCLLAVVGWALAAYAVFS